MPILHRRLSLILLATGVLLATIVAVLPRAANASLVAIDLHRLTALSRYIVRGEVVEMRSYRGVFARCDNMMLTDVRIRVQETWKDTAGKRSGTRRGHTGVDGRFTPSDDGVLREITVTLLGGTIGERWQICPESPRFRAGEKVAVFVRELDGKLWTAGWLQGKYRLGKAQVGDKLVDVVEGHPELPVKRTQPVGDLRARVRAIALEQKATAEANAATRTSSAGSTAETRSSTAKELKR